MVSPPTQFLVKWSPILKKTAHALRTLSLNSDGCDCNWKEKIRKVWKSHFNYQKILIMLANFFKNYRGFERLSISEKKRSVHPLYVSWCTWQKGLIKITWLLACNVGVFLGWAEVASLCTCSRGRHLWFYHCERSERVEIATLGSTLSPGFFLVPLISFQGKPWARGCPWVRLGGVKEGGMVLWGKEQENLWLFTIYSGMLKGWVNGQQNSWLVNFVPEPLLSFSQISSIYRETASNAWN